MSADLEHAKEVMLDAFLTFVHGRDDDELVFIDGALRELAAHLDIRADFAEVEPMTAGEFRRRWRSAKESLARGDSRA